MSDRARVRRCQRCEQVAPYCTCPRFRGEPHMECQDCGALAGQHLLDFAYGRDTSICPEPPEWTAEDTRALWRDVVGGRT